MSKISGGCLCGDVEYKSEANPIVTAICNCTHCQHQSGSAFSLNVAIPLSELKVTKGNPTVYYDKADSGNTVERHFCSKCGSPLFSILRNPVGIVAIKGGSLNDTSWLQPQVAFWCDSSQSWWNKIDDGLMHLPKGQAR